MPRDATDPMQGVRIPYPLMLALSRLYPPRCIRPDEDPIAAHRYAAKVELVEWLREHHNKQGEQITAEVPIAVDEQTGVSTYAAEYADILGEDDT